MQAEPTLVLGAMITTLEFQNEVCAIDYEKIEPEKKDPKARETYVNAELSRILTKWKVLADPDKTVREGKLEDIAKLLKAGKGPLFKNLLEALWRVLDCERGCPCQMPADEKERKLLV